MDEMNKLMNKVEYLFLKEIIKGLRDHTLTIPDSKKYAIEFIKLKPFASIEDAKHKIEIFTSQYVYFETLKKYMEAYHQELQTEAVIMKMKKHIENNNIDEALQLAQQT